MYCLRCGREIPDGELFCQSCAKKPIEREQEPRVPVKQPEAAPLHQPEEIPEPSVKRRNRLIIPFLCVCLLTVLAGAFTGYMYHQMQQQKASYRVKEANLAIRENEISDLQSNYEDVVAQLEEAKETISEKEQELAALQKQMIDQQSAASQNEYDAAAAQQALEQLQQENSDLNQENTDLNQEKDELQTTLTEKIAQLETANVNLEAMTTKYNTAKAKADFLDSYVVFVNNNGTKLYHSYDCSDFTKSNFWAYSRKLAENYGYTACPKCS